MTTSGFNILHVEDDPNDVLLLQRAFRKLNQPVNVSAVNDGDQAVAYLSGNEQYSDREKFPYPGLVLLDLKMPRKSGLEVLAWIRANEKTQRTIVVVFTSSRHDEDVNRAYLLGANSYMVKPVGFESLLEMVKSITHYWGTLNQGPPS
jgi:CheY-like chemotaxis protein